MKPRNSNLQRAIACALGLATTTTVLAHEGPSRPHLEEMIVHGSKIPKTITELTHSVSVVNEVEIEKQAFTDVTEILRNQAGVEFKQSGGPGQYNYLKMRGLGSDNILVVLDGVKINRPSGGDTRNLLSQLDPNMIESIEILRGPQATLYGANATAGVIVITTKSGDHTDARIGFEAGSLKWRKGSASLRDNITVGDGKLLYSFNASETDSDNTHKYEYFEDTTLQGKVDYQAERWSVGASVFDVDNSFGYAELDEAACCQTRASHWAYQTPDPNQSSDTGEQVISLYGEMKLTDTLSQKLQLSRAENTYAIHDRDDGLLGMQLATDAGIVSGAQVGDALYIYDRNRGISLTPLAVTSRSNVAAFYEDESEQADYQLLFTGHSFNLLGGIEYQEQSAKQWGSYGASDNEDSQISYYGNGDLRLFDEQLVLSLGLRLDDYESWGEETTGNVGAAWHISDSTTLYANYGTSFKPATMSQLFNPTTGDPGLMPEEGRTAELGVRYDGFEDRLAVEGTLWRTEIDDIIFFDYSLPNPRRDSGFGLYNNGAEAQTQGVELTWSYLLDDTLTLRGNYTYTDSHQRAVGGDWVRTVQIARNKGNLGLDYELGPIALGINAYYAGPRLRWAGDVEMKEYVRVDTYARIQATDQLQFSLRVENLFDEEIEEGLGYEEPGVYAIAGVEYKFY